MLRSKHPENCSSKSFHSHRPKTGGPTRELDKMLKEAHYPHPLQRKGKGRCLPTPPGGTTCPQGPASQRHTKKENGRPPPPRARGRWQEAPSSPRDCGDTLQAQRQDRTAQCALPEPAALQTSLCLDEPSFPAYRSTRGPSKAAILGELPLQTWQNKARWPRGSVSPKCLL